jgi:hypothetical protein
MRRLITYRGRTKTLAAWAKEIGMQQTTLRSRLKMGWSLKRALSTETAARHLTFRGETKTATKWAEELGISLSALSRRLDRWPVKRALSASKGKRGPKPKDGGTPSST